LFASDNSIWYGGRTEVLLVKGSTVPFRTSDTLTAAELIDDIDDD